MAKKFRTILIRDLFQIIDEETRRRGFKAKDVKYASAKCRDDSMDEMDVEARKIGYANEETGKGIMHLEGAAALPIYGESLVGAFYHHIPDKGVGVIVFGPHYGIDSKGRIGYVDREGKSEIGKSCGANHGVLSLWKRSQFGPYENDPELSEISRILRPDRKKIMESHEPIKTMAECEYTRFLEILTNYVINVQNKEHHKFPVLIASGIYIDTPWDKPNEFILKSIGWIEGGKVSYVELNI